MIDNLAVGLALALIGIGVLGMLVSGARAIIDGRSEFKKVSIMALPVIVFVISYFTMGTFDQAGIATLVLMMGLMVISIVLTGTRGTFKF